MKADVCISFYRRQDYWPLVLHGLKQAQEHISRIIVVNAEPWDWLPTSFGGIPIACLFTKPLRPKDFNYSAMVNEGILRASSEYVVHMDDDVILKPTTIPNLLRDITPMGFHAGTCYSMPADTTPDELDESDDEIQTVWRDCTVPEGPFSGPLWAINRQSFLDTGGFDERLVEYANQDGEFIRRWMVAHGYDSCKLTNATAYQIEPDKPRERAKPKDPYFYEVMDRRSQELTAKWGPYKFGLKRNAR
jgi:hypothetical protein